MITIDNINQLCKAHMQLINKAEEMYNKIIKQTLQAFYNVLLIEFN